MNHAWSWTLISLVILLFFAFPAWGLWKWTPRRGRLLKHVEIIDENTITRHVAFIRLRHPEIVKQERLDRHPAYVWTNLILLVFGLIVFLVAAPYSNLGGESLGTRGTLAGSLLIGSCACLIGSLLGRNIGGHYIGRGVAVNDTAPMLGDDVRAPYVLAWCGLLSTAISMGFYGYTVITAAGTPRLLTTLGGIAAAGFMGMCLTLIPLFIRRTWAFTLARDVVLTEAYAIMAEQDGNP